jgi:hypothetical protein
MRSSGHGHGPVDDRVTTSFFSDPEVPELDE